jgi:hypothetical protein
MKLTSRSVVRRPVLPMLLALVLLTIALAWLGVRTKAAGPRDLASLAREAISSDPAAARAAIAALRAEGPAGLRALCAAYDGDIQRHVALPAASIDARWQRIAAALDGVGQQKDCYASRLYWYTDLARAEREAKASGKPILSLRLLGNLNEDLSCANSRFFRTALYPNAQVSEYLRTHYVLHWKSVRPVPTFTLDFGDGRKIVRTLTGNSIHYVLDARGRPVDALPGLYGPQAFLRHLTEDEAVAKKSAALADETAQRAYVQVWHQAQFDALAEVWTADGERAYGRGTRIPTLVSLIAPVGNPRLDPGAPGALRAAPLAVGKGVVELPVVSALSASNPWAVGAPPLEWGWDQLGQVHAADAVLDANSRALMASKHPDLSRIPDAPVVAPRGGLLLVAQPAQPAATPALASSPMDRLVANFERAIAQDSARNEYVYHAKLHQWFAAGEVTGGVEALNARVYSDLFLTPDADPWLGLAPAGAYSGLPDDGLVRSAPPRSATVAGVSAH